MAFLMLRNFAPQYSQNADVEPSRQELRARYKAFDHKTAYWPHQLSHRGIVLPRDLFPDRARMSGRAKHPPHIIGISMFPGVSHMVRELIEALEPGLHQFVDIPVTLKSGEPTPMRYSALNVLAIVDDYIDFDKTELPSTVYGEKRCLLSPYAFEKRPIYVRRDAIDGKHLWRSPEISFYMTVSDELCRRMQAAKVFGYNFLPCIEI
jgi:hypothetical protein